MQNDPGSPPIDISLLRKSTSIFQALGHAKRVQLIRVLHTEGAMTVTELYHRLHLKQSETSKHLGLLRRAKFVLSTRRGKHVVYEVNAVQIHKLYLLARDLVEDTFGR